MADWRIVLEVSAVPEGGPRTAISYRLRVNGQVVFANLDVTGEQLDAIETIGERYHGLFDVRPTPPTVRAAQLQVIGSKLFELWLKPFWAQLTAGMPTAGRRLLVIASDQPDVLNLPWELLRLPDGAAVDLPLGVDPAWGICRYPRAELPTDFGTADDVGRPSFGSPLRVLFLASSPSDYPELDFEREEQFLIRAIGNNATVEIGDLGTFDELQDRINEFRPHIVHLSGHGRWSGEGAAFAFEHENGTGDLRPARRFAALFRGTTVRCVFVSGCGTGFAPSRRLLGGICQSLVASGVPLAIGWAASVGDTVAAQIAKSFYSQIVNDLPVDLALAAARTSVWDDGPQASDPSWSLPVLYASASDMHVRLAATANEPARAKRPDPFRALPSMTDDHAGHLVGRRRELQTLLPALRNGKCAGVILTGMDGTGKSSLATRLVRRLEASGRKPIVIKCSAAPLTAPADILKEVGWEFERANIKDSVFVNNEALQLEYRFRAVIDGLNDNRFTLVIDQFDRLLDNVSRRFLNDDIRRFYENLLSGLVGDSWLVVTSRFLPSGAALPSSILEMNLGELSENAYFKVLLRDDLVRKKYLADRVSRRTLIVLRNLFGSSPKFTVSMRNILGNMDLSTLGADMTARARSRTAAVGPVLAALEAEHETYCAGLNLGNFSNLLDAASLSMLSRAAVHPGPLSLGAIAKVGNEPSLQAATERVDRWRNSALVHIEAAAPAKAWSIVGAIRAWLAAPARLADAEWRAAHLAAAEFFDATADGLRDGDQDPELRLSKLDCRLAALGHDLALFAADPRDSTRLLDAMERANAILLEQRCYDELMQVNRDILEYLPHPEPATWIAKAHLRLNQYKAAGCWYEKALELAGSAYPVVKGHALQGLAVVASRQPDGASAAREYLLEAEKLQDAVGDRKGKGVTLHQLGSIAFEAGDYTAARTMMQEALDLLEGTDADEERQAAWHQLGSIALEDGSLVEAKEKLQSAQSMAQSIRNVKAEAAAIHQLGRLAAKESGSPWQAVPQLLRALDLRQRIGDAADEAQTFRRLGETLLAAGEKPLAIRFLVVARFLYDGLEAGPRAFLAQSVDDVAGQLGLDAAALANLNEDVQQAYLRDRGVPLARAASQAMPKDDGRGVPTAPGP